MRNFKLAAARIIGVLALALGFYAYHLHSKNNRMTEPPCLPGFVLSNEHNPIPKTCVKDTM